MAVRKLSVALEEGVAEAAHRAAERDGLSLSGWLNHAAESKLAIESGLAAVLAWEADQGELTEAELAAADVILDRVTGPARRGR